MRKLLPCVVQSQQPRSTDGYSVNTLLAVFAKTWPTEASTILHTRCLRFTDHCDMGVRQEASRAGAAARKQPRCLDGVRVPTPGRMSSHCLCTAVKLTSKPAHTGWIPHSSRTQATSFTLSCLCRDQGSLGRT